MSELAILGGPRELKSDPGDVFDRYPEDVMKKMEEAVLEVLHEWKMSRMDITKKFEKRFADWHGMEYGLGFNNGTASLLAAMFGLKLGKGDEIICPSITYWASALPIYNLRGSVVFCDIDPYTLCLDPEDLEKRITDRTKAVVVVHFRGMPADMDRIMEIADKHDLKVIEDVSHAHGGLYKGQKVGTFGDVAAFSLMSGKSFATGEAGVMITNDKEIYERAIAFGFYNRHSELTIDYLKETAGLPWGGFKNRVHQMSSALGMVMLDYYPEYMEEVQQAMNYFWDQLEDVPGLVAHRPGESKMTKAGWYSPSGLYEKDELGGLSITRFCEALKAEGVNVTPGCNKPLHLHPLFNTVDIYNEGAPTRTVNTSEDILQPKGTLPVSEGIQKRLYDTPLFFRYRPEIIKEYAAAYRKVAENYKELLPGDEGDPDEIGGWSLTFKGEF